MAGIDKIYGTEQQLIELRAWLKKNKPEYLKYTNDPDSDNYNKSADIVQISNFPEEADVWLYKHCPIKHITDSIHEQYNGDPSHVMQFPRVDK